MIRVEGARPLAIRGFNTGRVGDNQSPIEYGQRSFSSHYSV